MSATAHSSSVFKLQASAQEPPPSPSPSLLPPVSYPCLHMHGFSTAGKQSSLPSPTFPAREAENEGGVH